MRRKKRFIMKKTNKVSKIQVFGLIAIIAVIGVFMVACDNNVADTPPPEQIEPIPTEIKLLTEHWGATYADITSGTPGGNKQGGFQWISSPINLSSVIRTQRPKADNIFKFKISGTVDVDLKGVLIQIGHLVGDNYNWLGDSSSTLVPVSTGEFEEEMSILIQNSAVAGSDVYLQIVNLLWRTNGSGDCTHGDMGDEENIANRALRATITNFDIILTEYTSKGGTELLPVNDRWNHFTSGNPSATITHSVSNDGVCTITVGGTPEPISWDRWKAATQYYYPVIKDKHYTYTFEAWTESGTRDVGIQYYWDEKNGAFSCVESPLTITTTRTQYTVTSSTPVPLDAVVGLAFQGADQIGTFYVKIIKIEEIGASDFAGAVLQNLLDGKAANDADNPHTITLNINNFFNIKETLFANPNKYVILDLSSSIITGIPNDAFLNRSELDGCETLVGIILPNTVTSIGGSAFEDCENLKSVTLGNGVKSIGNWAFAYCHALTDITIPNSVISIGERAFNFCGITSISVPDSVQSIGYNAFFCEYLTEINVDSGNTAYSSQDGVLYNKAKTFLIKYPMKKAGTTFSIPSTVISIESEAFIIWNSYLTSITIPDSVQSIGYNAFSGSSLTEINVSSGNTAYSSQDGVLYNKSKTSLIKYPNGKGESSFSIPNTVISIEGEAFWNVYNLTSVTIPNSVQSIGNNAFAYCYSLTSVTFGGMIPSSGFNVLAFGESDEYYNPGDLRAKHLAGGAGTYTKNGPVWTKN
jgi:hypothetical protein